MSGPAYIEEILVKQASHFRKDRVSRMLSRAIGEGLIVSKGELWRRQRRLMQPAFHQGELRSYGGVMVDLACEAVASWRSGEVRNLHEDMMALTLNIVAKLLFGADLAADAQEIGHTISALMEDFSGELGLIALTPFGRLPRPRTWRVRRSVRRLDQIVYRDHRSETQRRSRRERLARAIASGQGRGWESDDRPAASQRNAGPVRRGPRPPSRGDAPPARAPATRIATRGALATVT